MKSATMAWRHAEKSSELHSGGWQAVSAALALGQWVCAPLLSFGAALLALTLLSSVPTLHEGVRMLELAASLLGTALPVTLMVRARQYHRKGRLLPAMLANIILILCTLVMLVNVVRDGRLF